MNPVSSLLPADRLSPTPSSLDGISIEVEELHRIFGCELIQEAGIVLNLPQVVNVTAQNIFHRFFFRKSFSKFDALSIAMGALLLASKVEEQLRTLREIVFAFYSIYLKRRSRTRIELELGGQLYNTWKAELITIERIILKELGFSLYNIMDHPHKYILYFIKAINGDVALAQVSWGFLNDSMRTSVCLEYDANYICCAAIFLAARKLRIWLPGSEQEEDVLRLHQAANASASSSSSSSSSSVEPRWWEIFGADLPSIVSISNRICELYKMKKITWVDELTETAPIYIERTDAMTTVATTVVVVAPTASAGGGGGERGTATPSPVDSSAGALSVVAAPPSTYVAMSSNRTSSNRTTTTSTTTSTTSGSGSGTIIAAPSSSLSMTDSAACVDETPSVLLTHSHYPSHSRDRRDRTSERSASRDNYNYNNNNSSRDEPTTATSSRASVYRDGDRDSDGRQASDYDNTGVNKDYDGGQGGRNRDSDSRYRERDRDNIYRGRNRDSRDRDRDRDNRHIERDRDNRNRDRARDRYNRDSRDRSHQHSDRRHRDNGSDRGMSSSSTSRISRSRSRSVHRRRDHSRDQTS